MIKMESEPGAIETMRSQIDLTKFIGVKCRYRDGQSEILDVIEVHPDQDLAEVAGYFYQGINVTPESFKQLVDQDLFRLLPPESVYSISNDRWCDVIMLPPFYLVKFRR